MPLSAGAAILCSIGWALNRGQLPPADFTFVNGTEVKSLDPAIVTGQPENRMINALFEGLTRWDPQTLEPKPGVDFFDRLLVAQAMTEPLKFLTANAALRNYSELVELA